MSHAVTYDRFGGPEVLHITDMPTPIPGPGHVHISVYAAGLNPVDAKTFEGLFPIRPAEALHRARRPARWFTRTFPRTAGRDFSGIINAVGPDVTGLEPGQHVMGTLRSAPGDATNIGSLTTDLIAPSSDVISMPDGLSFQTAATLGVAAQTASGALRALDVTAGDVLAISGAAGGVGSIATQLALRAGAEVLAIASPHSLDQVTSWGAIPVSYDSDITATIQAAAPSPVTAFLDCYGGHYVELATRLGVHATRIGTLVPSPAVALHKARFTGSKDARPDDLGQVAELAASNTLRIPPVHVIPFDIDSIRQGYTDVLTGSTKGKLAVQIHATISTSPV